MSLNKNIYPSIHSENIVSTSGLMMGLKSSNFEKFLKDFGKASFRSSELEIFLRSAGK